MPAQQLAADCDSLKGPSIGSELPMRSKGTCQVLLNASRRQVHATAMLACLSKVGSLLAIDFAQDLDGHWLHPTSDPSIHLHDNMKERSTAA